MFVRLKKSPRNINPIVQIVENTRIDGKVRQKVLASLGTVKDDNDLDRMRNLAKNLILKLDREKRQQTPMFEENISDLVDISTLEDSPAKKRKNDTVRVSDLKHTETVNDGFELVISKIFAECGFDKICDEINGLRSFDILEVLKCLTAQRFLEPSSKHRSFLRQEDIGFSGIGLHQFYRCMDHVLPHAEEFQKQGLKARADWLEKAKVDCIFMDVTTLYCESVIQDEMRDFGFSKDCKFGNTQVVLCIIVDDEGIPLCYEAFSGRTAEVSTVIPVVEKMRRLYEIKKVTIICDRGLSSTGNIEEFQKHGVSYVVATKIKHLPKDLQLNDTFTFAKFYENAEEDELVLFKRIAHPKIPKTDLIVTWSKMRAKKDANDRERMIKKLENKLNKQTKASQSFKKLLNNAAYKTFTKVKDQKDSQKPVWELDQNAISRATSWDGFHALMVSAANDDQKTIETESAMTQYRSLWRVEETFRIAKSYLEIRPIFHWNPKRVKAHILVCYISLYLERTLAAKLKKENTPMTPDEIRYALSKVSRIHFIDERSGREGIMESSLPPTAVKIFKALGISTRRKTYLKDQNISSVVPL